MQPTADYLAQAQTVIHKVFTDARPRLLAAHGEIDELIKADNSPVTELDKQLELELRDALRAFDASVGLEGEEHPKEGNAETFWLIDPIDGTESFVRGMPAVRHMATLIAGGQPVYAYIFNPLSEKLYTATAGQGAFCNGARLQGSQRPAKRCWIEFAALLDNPVTLRIAKAVLPHINGYRIIGDFPIIAEGKEDGMLVHQSKGGPWDYAPRALLFKEAGLKVANLGMDTYDFRNNDWLAIHEEVFDELMPVIMAAIEAEA